jgi:hypothetical protein
MRDTSPDAERAVREAIRRTDPIDRMRRDLAHSEMMRDLALSRLRARHPAMSTLALVEMLLGERLVPEGCPRRDS